MPVYQGALFIRKAIASVQAQTISDWELIIVDNASKDGTWEIMQDEASKDPRIRIFRNPSNVGLSKNWNISMSHACGEWIGTLAADDIYLPDALEKIQQVVRDHDIMFWAHSHYSVYPDGRKDLIRPFDEAKHVTMTNLAEILYLKGNLFGEISCYFLSAQAVKKTGTGVGEDCSTADLDFYLRVALANPLGRAFLSPQILAETTIHSASESSRYINSGQSISDVIVFIGDFCNQDWSFKIRIIQAFRAVYCILRYGSAFTQQQLEAAVHSTKRIIRTIF